jgi:serine phosphatase RsbU (regulator of sigma subunit)
MKCRRVGTDLDDARGLIDWLVRHAEVIALKSTGTGSKTAQQGGDRQLLAGSHGVRDLVVDRGACVSISPSGPMVATTTSVTSFSGGGDDAAEAIDPRVAADPAAADERAQSRWICGFLPTRWGMPVFGVGASLDDELWFVPGFIEVAAGGDVLATALEASHLLPPDRLDALARRAARAIGANDVSMWLIDYGHAWLMPETDPGGPQLAGQAEPLAVATTAAGRVFARAASMESDEPNPHRWVPLLDGTERLGVLRFDFAQPLSDAQRKACDVISSLVGQLLVSKRAHTDLYDIQRRRGGMSLAAEMQWQQLPPLQSSTPTVVVAGFLEPAYSVGGDGFDYSMNGDELDITIYDAVGHGLRSALLSALIIASLRHGRRRGLGLCERLSAADQALESVFAGDFVTAQLAAVSVASGEVEWVNAGHPAPMLIRRGEVVGELHCPPRPPLGLHSLQTTPTVVATVRLEPDDRVLFYTDGLIEGGRRGGERFGVDRLMDLLQRASRDGHGCAETVRRLGHAVIDHAAHELTDDATMVLVEWRSTPSKPPVQA